MGKWSEIRDVSIYERILSQTVLESTWSIRVALVGVQRVGFVMTSKKPKEKRRSTYSEAALAELYFKTSILKSRWCSPDPSPLGLKRHP